MDDVVLAKLESLCRSITRVEQKTPASLGILLEDYDIQDIIVLNLERAVQTCVDIGLHLLSSKGIAIPETMAETFHSLARAGVIDEAIAERMVKAVGFRNTAVHAYQAIDWAVVYAIITQHLGDFRAYARQVGKAARDG